MANADDVARILTQERGLVFPEFSEEVGFRILALVRDRAVAEAMPIVCDVRTWDRPIAYMAMPGSSGDNPVWALRKSNTVKRLLKSSYRAMLEVGEKMFPPHRNLPVEEFALSGGSFPISVRGAGIIGTITVSGMHERIDHEIVVGAICTQLGLDKEAFALPPLAPA